MQYKASIILACYNKEDYLERALNSLVALSRFDEFEIIVVDDHSSDGSPAIAQEFASTYENITSIVFPQGSGGPSRPRNVGIERSTTDYLIFMDPDDVVINDGYSILLTKMEEYQSDILIGTRIGVNEHGVRVFTDFIDERFTYVNEKSPSIALDLLNRRPFILKTIYRKQMIVENGISFNEKLRTSEDEAFDMRCVAAAKRITKINDVVYQYTVEAKDSITTKVSMSIYEGLYDVFVELADAYQLSFSKTTVAERLIGLVDAFYLYRISFLKTNAQIDEACECLYQTFDKFGYELFDHAITRKSRDLVDAIRARDLRPYINVAFIKHVNHLEREAGKIEKRLNKELSKSEKRAQKQRRANVRLKKKLGALQKLHKRKIVRLATSIAKKTSRARIQGTYHAPHKATSPQSKAQPQPESPELQRQIERLAHFTPREAGESNGYWVFTDRSTNGMDNAEALYRFVATQHIHDKIAFVLRKDSHDWDRLASEGFNLVEWDSDEHWTLLQGCDYYFTSHCDGYLLEPWYYCGRTLLKKKVRKAHPVARPYKLVFLQHGVIRSDLSSWLGRKPFYRIVASSPIEAASLLSIPQYRLGEEQIALTGLPRWDKLSNGSEGGIITIFPTWRKELYYNSDKDDFPALLAASPFLQNWTALCNSDEVKELARTNTVQFVTHADNAFLTDVFKERFGGHLKVITYTEVGSFSDIVNHSKLLITDYSSFSFDFLYLRKPVIYFDFEKNALANNYKGMEYERYGFYCTDLSQAEEAIRTCAASDFHISTATRANIDQLLPPTEPNHCKKLVENILGRQL